MNEQLQSKLVEILSSIQETTRQAGDFAIVQLPDIAQSYVLYGRVTSTVSFLSCLLATALLAYVALVKGLFDTQAVKKDGYFKGDWQESRVFCAGIGGILSLASLLPLFTYGSAAALVWLAPKVWLLKELAAFIK